ncbi:cyclase family protein [Thermocatellispora tengchongensis]|uniref:cyclase family protein n=1 Tax=Thermocatellispora tengchongensis TaxID=1073253 RepID=UPI0036447CEA
MRILDILAQGQPTVIDLAQPLQAGMPCSPTHPGFHFALTQRHGDGPPRPDGITGSAELIVLGGHVGTHMDALCHVAADGLMYGGVEAATAVTGGRYHVHGIDQVPPMVCRGCSSTSRACGRSPGSAPRRPSPRRTWWRPAWSRDQATSR